MKKLNRDDTEHGVVYVRFDDVQKLIKERKQTMFNNILDALVAVFVGLMLAIGALSYFDVLTK